MTGTRLLLRTSLRHDGRLLVPWILIVTLLSASSPLLYPLIFDTQQERATLAATIGANPALGLIFGPAHDLLSTDGFNAWRSLTLGGFITAMSAVLAVVRATRGQEDSGQAELLASGVMGRGARLATGVLMASTGALATGIVAAVVTVACGGGWGSTALLCATFTTTGLMFAGVAALASQVAADRRMASTISLGTLGFLFALRGLAYSLETPSWTLWANPLGWMTQTEPVVSNSWWPLLPALLLATVLVVAAFLLQDRRDFAQGLLSPPPGPADGQVRGPWALTWRLNRELLLTWLVVSLALGTVFGYFTTSIDDLLGSNEAVQGVLASGATTQDDLVSAFLVTILSLVGIICSVPGIQIMLRIRSEEVEDRVEPLIATSLSRGRYYLSGLVSALTASTLLVTVAGTMLAIVSSVADAGIGFTSTIIQVAATLPAVWAVVAVSVMVVGARPALSIAAWAGVLASFGLTLLGPTFNLPGWALGISPFYHVPAVTDADATLTGLAVVASVACALTLAGWVSFQRRDLARE
ncbi:multidrug ABC transporter permease [Actinomyces sp. 2119]|nr:multidrug ABC transporter permease [Actinomyces sp. 2119]